MQVEGDETLFHHPLSKIPRSNIKPVNYVFDNADVILEVLDSRDPLGCRCIELEKRLKTDFPLTKLILVLTKIDLVPLDIVEKWQMILSREHPTVLFKANLSS